MAGRHRDARSSGGEGIGWKIGFDSPAAQQRLGIDAPLVGVLTSAGSLDPAARLATPVASAVAVEVEMAIWVDDAAGQPVEAVALAIEVVDLGRAGSLDDVVASNVCHLGFAVGDPVAVSQLPGQVSIGVEGADAARAIEADVATLVARATQARDEVAGQLTARGRRLRTGEIILTGALGLVPLQPGDQLTIRAGALGALSVARDEQGVVGGRLPGV